MNVMTEIETIKYISDNKCSVARYGDGEFKLCIGASAKSQKADRNMAEQMRFLLRDTNNKNLLVCIPRIYEPRSDWPTQEKWNFWKQFAQQSRYVSLLNTRKTYGSSFITRPDSSGQSSVTFYESIKALWSGKNVLLIKGEGTGFDKDKSIFSTARRYETLLGPERDSFSMIDSLVHKAIYRTNEDTVIVISLGPTATLLAERLSKFRQTLDLGHLGMFYAHVHPKTPGYIKENHEIH